MADQIGLMDGADVQRMMNPSFRGMAGEAAVDRHQRELRNLL